MAMRTTSSTVTFMHDFELDGIRGSLPAGAYDLALKSTIPDGMFPPSCMKREITMRLPGASDYPARAQTVTMPWQALEKALVRDREARNHETDLDLNQLLMAPIVRQLMLADGVSEIAVLLAVTHMPGKGAAFHAITE